MLLDPSGELLVGEVADERDQIFRFLGGKHAVDGHAVSKRYLNRYSSTEYSSAWVVLEY